MPRPAWLSASKVRIEFPAVLGFYKRSFFKTHSLETAGAAPRPRFSRGFDLTQKEFDECIGIGQNCLSTMEHGKVEIGVEILLRISREFGKSIEWLLAG